MQKRLLDPFKTSLCGRFKMEERILKINFNKSGSGSYTPKLALPATFINKMGITKEEREIKIIFDEEKKEIILKKY